VPKVAQAKRAASIILARSTCPYPAIQSYQPRHPARLAKLAPNLRVESAVSEWLVLVQREADIVNDGRVQRRLRQAQRLACLSLSVAALAG
jgi:hypothetical protein